MTGIRLAGERATLKPRRDPYFESQGRGLALGFRKMSTSSIGTWIARYNDKVKQKQVHHPLGDFAHISNSERYAEATKAARVWFNHVTQGGSTELLTVQAVCERYIDWITENKGSRAGIDAQGRFSRFVYPTALARVEITKLTPLHLEAWRKELRESPVLHGPRKNLLRSDSSLNRDMTSLRAALNKAYEDGLVTTDFAWRAKLKPIKNADNRRDVYLSVEERQRLLANAQEQIRPFIKGMCLLPLRPGALAQLIVKNYDKYVGTLTIEKDKFGKGRKILLPKQTAEFFSEQVRGKTPLAPIFTRADGTPWDKDSWKNPVKDSVITSALPNEASMYTLRHCAITDLIHNGLDTLSVAQISGTSILMIERHYGHLKQGHARNALATLAID